MNEYKRWLASPSLSEAEKAELVAISEDEKEIKERFFSSLSFGTAGLRGIMGVGLRRMNVHVVRHATQGFASLIAEGGDDSKARGAVVCYDCRINSREFAVEAACVLAGNGIKTKLFESMRPTPELSFAIREYGAVAGINITASHNTKEYNGYKVYWDDGAQLPPEHAATVAAAMAETDIFDGPRRMDFATAVKSGLIEIIGAETDEKYLSRVLEQAISPSLVAEAADSLPIVYTPFHGAGRVLVPEALRRLGVKKLYPVPEQMEPDGSFPTVKSPNPEYPEGFALSLKLAEKTGAKLIIGTDPDSDRIGVMALREGKFEHISGNRIGVLLLDYILTARRRAGTLPENAAALKSIVTTRMAENVANLNGVYIESTFTGFKFMAERMKAFERDGSHKTVFAYEESYGYLIGDFVRDKDAVTAAVLITEMASYYALRSMSLWDALEELFKKYGYFEETTENLVMPGLDGAAKMATLMASLRSNTPRLIGGFGVLHLRDYKSGTLLDMTVGESSRLEMSGSDVLFFELEGGIDFIVRPSGTEPKIKVYIMVEGKSLDDCARKTELCRGWLRELKY